MKKHLLAFAAISVSAITWSVLSNDGAAHSNGGGAPGSGSCTACHGGTDQTSDALGVLLFRINGTDVDTVPSIEYVPNANYVVLLGADESLTNTKFGFALSSNAGTLSPVPEDDEVQKINNYLTHTGSGTAADEDGGKFWGGLWTAPSSGTVNFQLYVNAANGNNGQDGDVIYAHTATYLQKSTGLANLFVDESTLVYPNPATDLINIGFELKKSGLVDVQIHNTSGQLVLSQSSTQYAAGKHHLSLKNELKQGLYLVQLKADDQVVTRRILIK